MNPFLNAMRSVASKMSRKRSRTSGPLLKSVKDLSRREERAFKAQARRAGILDQSIFGALMASGSKKIIGRRRTNKALWKYYQKPALRADIALGRPLSKIPGVGGLFEMKDKIPWGKHKGQKIYKDFKRTSILAPLVKARDIAEPIIVGIGLEKGLKSVTDKNKMKKLSEKKELHQKVAATMLRLNHEVKGHEKRAHAVRLLYKQAELGYGEIPQTYTELEEKIASLLSQDLIVVEKALELSGGNMKLDELDSSMDSSSPMNATEQFESSIFNDN